MAYRVALWHPELVTHVFTVCVPYAAPTRKYLSLEDFVATIAPHFAYQLQFRSGELENAIRSEEDIKKFLSALYGGRTEDREVGFDAQVGVLLETLSRLRPSRLLNEEVCQSIYVSRINCADSNQELDYYAKEFSRNGLNGPCTSLPHSNSSWKILTRYSKLVPHPRNQLQRRTRPPQPTHYRPRPLHPSPSRYRSPSPPRQGNDQDPPPFGLSADQHVSLGAVGETKGGE